MLKKKKLIILLVFVIISTFMIAGMIFPLKEEEELDSGKAETVLIIPPFGMTDALATQISIVIILIAAFGIGVYYIKKRVLK